MNNFKDFIKIMFNDNDYLCCGSLFENNVVKADESIGSTFYTINPINNKVDYGHKDKPDKYDYLTPRRADINCSSFRNFMFEMDSTELSDQRRILEGCGIPFSAIVFSGKKSLHALLSVDECLGGCHTQEGIDAYKALWSRLSLRIEHYANTLGFTNVVDPSGKNPSRFTRTPFTIRDNGKEQSLDVLNARIRFSDFQKLISECPRVFVPVIQKLNSLDIQSVEDFFETAPKALVNELKYPTNLCAGGMYPTMLRLSLWAKDLGIPKEIWVSVMSYRYFKALLAVGYPEKKLMVAIDHAFRS